MTQKKTYIAGASSVAKIAYCPHSAYLDRQGYTPSQIEINRKNAGNRYHSAQNKIAKEHDKKPPAAERIRLALTILMVMFVFYLIMEQL